VVAITLFVATVGFGIWANIHLILNPAPVHPQGKVKLMDGERVVFTEESNPQNYLKLVASGEVDETMLEALEDYVKRQKKRLAPKAASQAGYKIDLDGK
jgi:hypothetical protein